MHFLSLFVHLNYTFWQAMVTSCCNICYSILWFANNRTPDSQLLFWLFSYWIICHPRKCTFWTLLWPNLLSGTVGSLKYVFWPSKIREGKKNLKRADFCSNGFFLFLLNAYIIQSMFKLFIFFYWPEFGNKLLAPETDKIS